MKRRKWFGLGHEKRVAGPGDLTHFCAACAQPGINLCNTWEDDENQLNFFVLNEMNFPEPRILCRTKYTRILAFDGNFTAAHLKQKRPEDDVWLSPGTGMVVAPEPYKAHLRVAIETKDMSSIAVRNKFMTLFAEKDMSSISSRDGEEFISWRLRCNWDWGWCVCQAWVLLPQQLR
jgi:hypothetical protein